MLRNSEFELYVRLAVELLLELSSVSPRGVHVLVTIVGLIQLLMFLLLFVIVCQHFLVGLLVDHGFADWGATSLLGCLDHHFGLLVLAEVVREQFALLQFFVDAPQGGIVYGEIIRQVHFLVKLLFIFQNDPHRFPNT